MLRTNKCAEPCIGVKQQKNDEITRGFKSVPLAFLDEHGCGDMVALQRLRSDNIAAAGRNVTEWQSK
jgi:hypothetical protein